MATSTTKKTRTRMRKATPKPPRAVRVAKHTPPVTDPEAVFTFGNKLGAAALANPTLFLSPPNLPALTAGCTTLGTAITTAQGGTDAAQTALLAATIKVRNTIDLHASWIQGGANLLPPADAASYITTAGFQVAQAGVRVPVTAPELSNGPPTVVLFEVPNEPGFMMSFSEISVDGGKTYVRSVDSEHTKGEITGLTSGLLLFVRVRSYVRGSGYSPWTVLSIVVT